MSRTLYELTGDEQALFELLADTDGEITPEAEALIAEHEGNLGSKVDAYGKVLAQLTAEAEACKAEADRLTLRAKSRTAAVDRVKRRLLDSMVAMGRDKIAGVLFSATRVKNPASVEVLVPVDKLPDEYVRVIPESRVVDKVALLAALKGGVALPTVVVGFDEITAPDGSKHVTPHSQPIAAFAPDSYHVRVK